jgi:hypothetical protein
MPETLETSWKIFIEQYPQFMKLMRKLGGKDWYADGGYAMFIGQYHAGIYAQVYKHNWFNYTLDGIHFETGLTAESLETRKLQIDLHIGHRNLFDREKFNELTIPKMEEIVGQWEGEVKFSKSNLSDRLSLWVKFTKSGFGEQIAAGFTRLAELSPIIDEGLERIRFR